MSTQLDPSEAPTQAPLSQEEAARRLVRTALAFYALLTALGWVWRGVWAGEPLFFADAEAAARGWAPARDLALGVAAGAAVIAASWLVTGRTGWGERLARALAGLVGRPRPGQIVLLALASGVGEEAFFRGALQPRVGLVGASLLFGLAHFVPRRELLPWAGFSVAAGFLLGALFAWAGNLAAPVVAHALINGVNLTLLVRQYQEPRGGARHPSLAGPRAR